MSTVSPAPAPEPLPLGGYAPPTGPFDEAVTPAGETRPQWTTFTDSLARLGVGELKHRWQQAQALVRENGLAFSAYGDRHEEARPWQLDPLPFLIRSEDWSPIAAGLEQRARLIERVLADLYGPQDLLRRGILPPEILFAHPGYNRACHGWEPSGGRRLTLFSSDLARSPDGQWWVLGDRTEAPSGLGFALENRIIVSRVLPEAFQDCHVARLATFFIELRETLHNLAPEHRENPRIVLLSQGPESPNYFEDAYLSRYLGYTLAMAGDLTVRGGRAMLKTLGGLLPVDVILRRPNSESCDPLELDPRSPAGVAGLTQALRAGNVAMANALGTGIVESPIFMAFFPMLCQDLLNEELALPGVATFWCGNPDSRKLVLANLDRFVIKRAFRRRGQELEASRKLRQKKPDEMRKLIEAHPHLYVAQEQVERSSGPVWGESRLTSGRLALRAFVCASMSSPDAFCVMDGALARVSRMADPLELSLLAGEGSKDTWVLTDSPVEPVTLLARTDSDVPLRRGAADLPSRVADNFFWLGRHIERTDAAARLLRTTVSRLNGETGSRDLPELPILLRGLAELGQIEPGFAIEETRRLLPKVEIALPQAAFDSSQPTSLRNLLSQLNKTAARVRDRISIDTWRTLQRVEQAYNQPMPARSGLSEFHGRLDDLLLGLSAMGGYIHDSMTRGQAHTFLQIGRRIERTFQVTQLIRAAFTGPETTTAATLEAVLEVGQSLMTYRSRYLASLRIAPVLDLLLTDETNPRAVAFQLKELVEDVARLPRDAAQAVLAQEQRLSMSLLHTVRLAEIVPIAEACQNGDRRPLERLLAALVRDLPLLSNALNHRYFAHAEAIHQLAELRAD